MQPQELRIGSKCLWDNGNGTFTPYTIENYLDLKYADNLKPIELTEEILLKCGFEIEDISNEQILCLEISSNIKICWVGYLALIINDIFTPINNCEQIHLHELQNLHLCLTGKELEYKQ